MLVNSNKNFNDKLNKFFELVKKNRNNFNYLKDNWLNCIEKWAQHHKRIGLPLVLEETNNPVEVVNYQMKEYSNN